MTGTRTELRYSQADIENFKRLLTEREASLAQNFQASRHQALSELGADATGEVSHRHTHPADDGGLEFDRSLAVEAAERISHQLAEVRAAQHRLALGTYGVCEECEQLISVQRLSKVPETRYCGPCQRAAEEDEKLHRHSSRLEV